MRWSFSLSLVLPATNFSLTFSSTYYLTSSFLSSLIQRARLRSLSSSNKSKPVKLCAYALSIFSNSQISSSSSSTSFWILRLVYGSLSSSSSSPSRSSSSGFLSISFLQSTRSPFFSASGFSSAALVSIILL